MHHPRPDVIARGWLSDLIKTCREEIRLTKRRITSYEVWERVHTKVMDNETITDDGEPVSLPPLPSSRPEISRARWRKPPCRRQGSAWPSGSSARSTRLFASGAIPAEACACPIAAATLPTL